jgi:hypothetical protein
VHIRATRISSPSHLGTSNPSLPDPSFTFGLYNPTDG